MGCITTYSGEAFDPAQPDSQKIHIADIAHALSLLCRANGHFKRFYSVGQHCVNCALEAQARGYRPQVQLACLLHDASEAYLAGHHPAGQGASGNIPGAGGAAARRHL